MPTMGPKVTCARCGKVVEGMPAVPTEIHPGRLRARWHRPLGRSVGSYCAGSARLAPLLEACRHADVVPSKTYPDGSIDGRCIACGMDGFPLFDPGGDPEGPSTTPAWAAEMAQLLRDRDTALALLTRVADALDAAGVEVSAVMQDYPRQIEALAAERDSLRARVVKLEEDLECVRWDT